MTASWPTALPPALAAALKPAAVFAACQGAWLACVVGAAQGSPGTGVAIAAAVTAGCIAFGGRPGADLRLVLAALAVGLVWDSALAATGLVVYAAPGPLAPLAPAWILALWALLAVMLRGAFGWLHRRLPLAAMLGAIGGAASYAAAERLGACRFADPLLTPLVLAAGWAVMLPALLVLARRFAEEPSRAVHG